MWGHETEVGQAPIVAKYVANDRGADVSRANEDESTEDTENVRVRKLEQRGECRLLPPERATALHEEMKVRYPKEQRPDEHSFAHGQPRTEKEW
jgi:hypothetical protein